MAKEPGLGEHYDEYLLKPSGIGGPERRFSNSGLGSRRHSPSAIYPEYSYIGAIFCFHRISTMHNCATGRRGSSTEASAGGVELINANNS